MATNNLESAFEWIIGVLQKNRVRFHVTGGFAAHYCYGSSRKVKDIDIAISQEGFWRILPDIRSYLVFGPGRYKDENFDVLMVTLNFRGREIDIGTRCKIYDQRQKRWRLATRGLITRNRRRVFGLRVPVVLKGQLFATKQALGRPQDRKDAKVLSCSSF